MDIKLFNEVSWGGNMLAPIVDWALREIGSSHNFELIENPNILSDMNIKKTPAIMVNGKIVLEGRIPSGIEMIEILEKSFGESKLKTKKE